MPIVQVPGIDFDGCVLNDAAAIAAADAGVGADMNLGGAADDGHSIRMQVEEQGENNVDITKNEDNVAMLVEMGFDPHRASEALTVCFGNIDE